MYKVFPWVVFLQSWFRTGISLICWYIFWGIGTPFLNPFFGIHFLQSVGSQWCWYPSMPNRPTIFICDLCNDICYGFYNLIDWIGIMQCSRICSDSLILFASISNCSRYTFFTERFWRVTDLRALHVHFNVGIVAFDYVRRNLPLCDYGNNRSMCKFQIYDIFSISRRKRSPSSFTKITPLAITKFDISILLSSVCLKDHQANLLLKSSIIIMDIFGLSVMTTKFIHSTIFFVLYYNNNICLFSEMCFISEV